MDQTPESFIEPGVIGILFVFIIRELILTFLPCLIGCVILSLSWGIPLSAAFYLFVVISIVIGFRKYIRPVAGAVARTREQANQDQQWRMLRRPQMARAEESEKRWKQT